METSKAYRLRRAGLRSRLSRSHLGESRLVHAWTVRSFAVLAWRFRQPPNPSRHAPSAHAAVEDALHRARALGGHEGQLAEAHDPLGRGVQVRHHRLLPDRVTSSL